MQMKTRFIDYDLQENVVDSIIGQLERHGQVAIGEQQKVTLERSRKVLEGSLLK